MGTTEKKIIEKIKQEYRKAIEEMEEIKREIIEILEEIRATTKKPISVLIQAGEQRLLIKQECKSSALDMIELFCYNWKSGDYEKSQEIILGRRQSLTEKITEAGQIDHRVRETWKFLREHEEEIDITFL